MGGRADGAADPRVVEAWIAGWAGARALPAPLPEHGGYRVEVGWPTQAARYVFPALLPAIAELASSIVQPWVFLKACATPAAMRAVLPSRWEIQRPGFMMTLDRPLPALAPGQVLPAGCRLEQRAEGAAQLVRVLAADGSEAASGRVLRIGQFAIYDRIATDERYRRQGLARRVMHELALAAAALGAGPSTGVLVATPEGRTLYAALGWQLHSPYTSAVVRAPATPLNC
ncbi:MAG: GNAT family N-acetyltransferase [Pseudomonadota bacterium]